MKNWSWNDTLDAIVVIGVLLIVGFSVWVLAYVTVPQANLPILSAVVSGLIGTVIGGYAGYRWGASKNTPKTVATADSGSASVTTTVTPDANKDQMQNADIH